MKLSLTETGQEKVATLAGKEDRTHVAITTLREMIISGKLMPSQHLIEADLATELQINRANIRTALIVLEHEGLVSRELNRGARVKVVTEDEALEIDEVRIVLESFVARKAAENITPEATERLLSVIALMKENYARHDYQGVADLNGTLHEEIVSLAGSSTLKKVLSNLKHQLVRAQYRKNLLPEKLENSIKEHARIVDSIISGDADAAEKAMHEHLETVLTNLKRLLGK